MDRESLVSLRLTRGTLVRVTWLDIQADPTGDTNEAYLARRPTFAVFWEQKDCPKTGVPIIVVTDTIDPDGSKCQGWTAIPISVITHIEVIRRPRKVRGKRKDSNNGPEPNNVL
jgi:hypothetical protein